VHVLVATLPRVRRDGYALAAKHCSLFGLCALWDLHGHGAVDRRYLDLSSERRDRHWDRCIDVDVGAHSTEHGVCSDTHTQKDMPRCASTHAGIALVWQADVGTILDTCIVNARRVSEWMSAGAQLDTRTYQREL